MQYQIQRQMELEAAAENNTSGIDIEDADRSRDLALSSQRASEMEQPINKEL